MKWKSNKIKKKMYQTHQKCMQTLRFSKDHPRFQKALQYHYDSADLITDFSMKYHSFQEVQWLKTMINLHKFHSEILNTRL